MHVRHFVPEAVQAKVPCKLLLSLLGHWHRVAPCFKTEARCRAGPDRGLSIDLAIPVFRSDGNLSVQSLIITLPALLNRAVKRSGHAHKPNFNSVSLDAGWMMSTDSAALYPPPPRLASDNNLVAL